jgi:hypothetical protein
MEEWCNEHFRVGLDWIGMEDGAMSILGCCKIWKMDFIEFVCN